MKNKALAINSIAIVLSSSIIGIILHELSHYALASYFNLEPILHNDHVSFNTKLATEIQLVSIAAIGPLFSGLTGIIFLSISTKMMKPSLCKLFFLWQGMNGILIFLGYFLIAPFAKNGDTGRVFHFLELPLLLVLGFAILAILVTIKIFKKFSSAFSLYKSPGTFVHKDHAKSLFLYPIVVSIFLITLLSLPIPKWFSLLPTVFMPMTYISTMKAYEKLIITEPEYEVSQVSIPLLIATVILLVVFVML